MVLECYIKIGMYFNIRPFSDWVVLHALQVLLYWSYKSMYQQLEKGNSKLSYKMVEIYQSYSLSHQFVNFI